MRVLVTGAGGFLGQRLLRVLRCEGHDPVATTRNSAFASVAGTHVLTDALDASAYGRLIAALGVEAVVNGLAAGVDPSDRDVLGMMRANTQFPVELALAAKAAGAAFFVQIGSSAEYAAVEKSGPVTEDDPPMREKLYGATKAAGTLLLEPMAAAVGLDYAILRLFNIFGPGEKSHRLFPSLVRRLSLGERVSLSAGAQVRDFLYVDDACRAICKVLGALECGAATNGIYNLASGNGVSVRNFATMIADEMGADPQLLRFGELPLRADDLAYVVADTTRLNALIGTVGCTPLRDAIASTLAVSS